VSGEVNKEQLAAQPFLKEFWPVAVNGKYIKSCPTLMSFADMLKKKGYHCNII